MKALPWAEDTLTAWGENMGSADAFGARRSGQPLSPQLPQLRPHRRAISDTVEFHPAWHQLMTLAARAGEHFALPWSAPRTGAHVARGAMYIVHGQVENGTQCPVDDDVWRGCGATSARSQRARARRGLATAHPRLAYDPRERFPLRRSTPRSSGWA